MNVNLRFFGATAEIVDAREFQLQLENGSAVANVIEGLGKKFPALIAHKLLFAINQEYVSRETDLKEGDELAVFTAVSGG